MRLCTVDRSLVRGTIEDRPNRFVLEVSFDGESARVFLGDPGALEGIVESGHRVLCAPVDDPARATHYDAISVFADGVDVSGRASLANDLFERALAGGGIPAFADYTLESREPSLPEHERADFLLRTSGAEPARVEVKSCTYVEEGTAKFPDRQTARGRRHLRSVRDLENEAHLVFVVQGPHVEALAPYRRVDPAFARLVEAVRDADVGVHAMPTAFDPPHFELRAPELPIPRECLLRNGRSRPRKSTGFIFPQRVLGGVAQSERKGIDMTTGAIAPKLLWLAWPLVVGNLLQTVYNIVDIFWVGRVSSEAVAGVSLMFPLAWMFISTAMGLTAATIALVSQHVGAGHTREADRVVAQSILLALAVAGVLATFGWTFRVEILRLIGAEGQVFTEALAYIEVIFLALPLTFLFFVFRAALQGAGDTKTAMWLMVISAGVNVVLDPFLILGWGPFAAMGTRGAGWATFIARAFATGAGIFILLRGGFGVKLRVGDLPPNPTLLRELIDVGYPASLDGWARSFAAVVMAAFVAPFGTAVIAAYGIGARLMSVTWSVAGAVGQAAATGVGQNLGAETPDRAARLTWVAAGGTMLFLLAVAVVCVLFPEIAVGIFVDDPAVIREGRIFLWIVAPFWTFFGGTMVIQGAFRGAGDTKVAMALSFLSRWILRVPLALVLAFSFEIAVPGTGLRLESFGIGVIGVWIAFSIGAFGAFVIAVLWFRRGRWTEGIIEEREEVPAVDGPPDRSEAPGRD